MMDLPLVWETGMAEISITPLTRGKGVSGL